MKSILTTISLSLLLITNSCSAQKGASNGNKDHSFKTTLEQKQIALNLPKNFKEVPVKDNPDVNYQYALKHDSLDFEIRFLVADINEALDLPNDKRSLSLFTSIVLNASGEALPNIPKIQELGQGVANMEYNADWVANSSFYAKSTFSKGFDINSVIALRKNDVAEVYVFFLFNDREKGAALVSKLATCLKFKK